MIYGNSNHPVLVKKIKLKIWSLRDEVEKVIEDSKHLEHDQLLEELRSEYVPNSKKPDLVLVKSPMQEESEEESTEDSADNEESAEISDDGEATENPDSEAEEEEEEAEADEENVEEQEESEGEDSSQEESDSNQEEQTQGEEILETKESTEETDSETKITITNPHVPEDKIAQGVCFLTDISMDAISFFSTKGFIHGQSIVIEFLIPTHFILNAEVMYTTNYNIGSRIISESRPSYRLMANWTFLKPGEKTLLRNFLKAIEPDLPKAPPPKAKVAAGDDDDDDDFADLEDLGL